MGGRAGMMASSGQSVFPGASGTLKMKTRGEFKFTVGELDPHSYFSYITTHPGATATWFWDFSDVSPTSKSLTLSVGVTFDGIAAAAYKWMIGKEAETEFAKCCVALKRLAEVGEMAAVSSQ
ncbi:hypothetical protein HDV05_003244 [Chytridiales sp. JEL 0842]|nr:hypothetical protein HDV05_003244 [Chytridiales sp. JEL 0842]